MEHGGDGAAPDTWLHREADEALPAGAWGGVFREGTRPVGYMLSIRVEGDYDAAGLADVAAQLRVLADAIDEQAPRLAALDASTRSR